MGNRPGKQPIGELRVPRQQWPVEIRADGVAEAAPFEPRLAVVPEACDDATERLRTVVEDRPARVVLEARDRLPPARVELALEKHVSDQSPVPGDRVQRKHACARLLRARSVAIEPAEQLVAATDGEHDRPGVHRSSEGWASRGEIWRN